MNPDQHDLLDSIRQAMPAIVAGEGEPMARVYSKTGVLQDYWDRPPVLPTGPSKEAILEAVCKVAEISRKDIFGPRRTRDIVRPRQVACYLIQRYRTKMSLPQIAAFMNNLDRTTVMHAVQRIRDLLEYGDEHTLWLVSETKRRLAQ